MSPEWSVRTAHLARSFAHRLTGHRVDTILSFRRKAILYRLANA